MSAFLKRWAITAVAVAVAAELVHGIQFTFGGLIVATLVLGILNAIVRPILIVVSLPAIVLSFGLFFFVINALLLYAVGHMLRDFRVDTFGDAFWGSLIISFVSTVLGWMIKTESPAPARRGPPPPPPPADTGKGPIIDV